MRTRALFHALTLLFVISLPQADAQCVSLNGSSYTQDFNTLAISGTGNVLPSGWLIAESDDNANATFTAGTGSSNAGDTYSFGAAGSTERALGGLRSGSLVPLFGACFTNNSGGGLGVSIGYTGEMWRAGVANRGAADRLEFQYSTNATSLATGAWTAFGSLNFNSPSPSVPAAGALDGNTNRTVFSSTELTGVVIPNGGTLWIRWVDFDISGADDGLAIDDFTLTQAGRPTVPSGNGLSTPSSISRGVDQPLLTVAVSPGSNPMSASYTVTADLTSIGGSSSQILYDDGTHGDATSGDDTFSFLATVPTSVSAGNKTIPVTIVDDLSRTGTASIALTVTCSFTGAIGTIQGSESTSPYEGCSVTTTGIVTTKKFNGFFLQSDSDGDPNTSDGIFVFTGGQPAVNPGDRVQVAGRVQEFVQTANGPSTTEISFSPAITPISSGNALPEAVMLTPADTNPAGGLDVLERFEGMRVHIDTLNVIAPTGGSKSEANATSTSNGIFYGVLPGIARPAREAGITVGDPLPAGAPATVTRFDNNPERIRVDTASASTALNVTSGAVVSNLTGPLDYAARCYTLLQEAGSTPTVSGNVTYTAVPAALPTEVTVANFNMERFYDDVNDPGGDVALTPAAFAMRLNKASLTIRNVLRYPDVLAIEEMESLTVLQGLAAKVNNDAVAAGDPNPNYEPHLFEGNDTGGIDVAFLVKRPRIAVTSVTQYGRDTTFTFPGSAPAILNDRPPLVLRGTGSLPAGSSLPFIVIVNHLRSLLSIDDPDDGARVRAKREAQAEFLANLIQEFQTADPNALIVSVGDYNAFDFSDGYVDVIGAIKGTPAPASEVTVASPVITNPALTDLETKLSTAQRYSYVFDGNAQTLDHQLVNSNLLPRVSRFAVARVNADFPESYRGDGNRPERLSDHDVPVSYLNLAPVADITSQFMIPPSAFPYIPPTGQYSGMIVLINRGGATNGPLNLVFTDLPAGVTLVNPSGTYNGSPYLTVPNSDGGLDARQAVIVPVRFSNASGALVRVISTAPNVYSGPLN